VVTRIVELSDGKFWWHDGNYTDYLLDKAERQAADAVIEHKRQMFLKKELAWVRQVHARNAANKRTVLSAITRLRRKTVRRWKRR
jgi:ATPase subunit of ABC transporter with duplicated ATPase domains